jgi:hypothetical protein
MIKRRLGIVFANVLILAIFLEVVLRLLAPRLGGEVGIAMQYVTTGKPYSQAWTPAWQQNRDHYWAMQPNLVDAVQYGSPSVSFRLTTNELWVGGGIGFRNKPIDFFVDAVVVGDSFGMCFTEQSDCWVDQLATRLNWGIVNLSQPVTGSTRHTRILRDFGEPLKPPTVIWQFFGNDFNDDYGLAVFRNELPALTQENVAQDSNDMGGWLRRNVAVFAVTETLITGRYQGRPASEDVFNKPYRVQYGANNEHTLLFGGQYELDALDMSREQNQLGLNLSRQAFLDAQELVATWGGRLVIVIIPTREEVYSEITLPQLGQDNLNHLFSARNTMQALCTEFALACYDPYDAFVERARNGEALYYSDDMHLNPHGNAVLAELLQNWLQS